MSIRLFSFIRKFYVRFRVETVDPLALDLFHAALHKSIIMNENGKCEVVVLPFSGSTILEMLGICAVLQGVFTSSCGKYCRRVFPPCEIVMEKSKVRFID